MKQFLSPLTGVTSHPSGSGACTAWHLTVSIAAAACHLSSAATSATIGTDGTVSVASGAGHPSGVIFIDIYKTVVYT